MSRRGRRDAACFFCAWLAVGYHSAMARTPSGDRTNEDPAAGIGPARACLVR